MSSQLQQKLKLSAEPVTNTSTPSSFGMIGGDGINDESNKMSPAPDTQIYLTKDTGFSPNAELANRMLVKAAEGFFGRMKVEAFYPEH